MTLRELTRSSCHPRISREVLNIAMNNGWEIYSSRNDSFLINRTDESVEWPTDWVQVIHKGKKFDVPTNLESRLIQLGLYEPREDTTEFK